MSLALPCASDLCDPHKHSAGAWLVQIMTCMVAQPLYMQSSVIATSQQLLLHI